MWTAKQTASLNILTVLQELKGFFWFNQQNFDTINGAINTLFWCSLVFGFIYFNFYRLVRKLLKSQRIPTYKLGQTVRFAWNICFYAASIFFLFFYRKYFLLGRIEQEIDRLLFPKLKNPLFLLSDNCSLFNSISLIFIAFYLSSTILDLKQRDFLEAYSKCLFIGVLICFNNNRYENYFVDLNLVLGLFQLFTDCLMIASLHTKETNLTILRIFLTLKLTTWSFVFLNVLPFNYLIPTLNSKDFKLWFNIFLWVWYGSCIWNSPILHLFYHQIYHQNSGECTGNNCLSRCILLKDFPDQKHFKNLQQAVIDIRSSNLKHKKIKQPPTDNPSATAFQTIKCIMTLKRKLRRIRENKGDTNGTVN